MASGIRYRNFKSDSVETWVPSGVFASLAAYLSARNILSSDLAAGDLYFDTGLGFLRVYTGSTWNQVSGTGTGPGSWDSAINIGAKVTTDNAAEIELSAATSPLLTLDANGTTNVDIFDVSSAAGTGDLINLLQGGTGLDINGTSGTWTVSKAGAAVFDSVSLADSKSLAFGTGSDVTVNWDTSNLLIEAATDNVGQIRIGSTNAIDFAVYGSTNTNIALFDVSAAIMELNGWTVHLQDTDELQFGDASGGDVSIVWDTSNLLIEAFADDTGQIRIGSTNAIDLAVYGSTATNIALFDVSTAVIELNGWDINIQDADSLFFGDGNDISIQWDTTDLLIDGAAADTQIKIGATNNQDLIVYGATITNLVTFDTDDSALEVIFDNFDLRLKDDDYILLGDNATAGGVTDGTIRWDNTNSNIEIVGDVDITGTLDASGGINVGAFNLGDDEALNFGNSNDFTFQYSSSSANLEIAAAVANDEISIGTSVNTDVRLNGATAAADVHWDASADTLGILDDAILGFGNTAASPDISFSWDQTRLNITGSGNEIRFGADDEGLDVVFYGETAGANTTWDESADQLVVAGGAQISLNDNVELLLGTGVTNAGDFSIASDGTDLLIREIASAGKIVKIGVSGKGLDVIMYGDDAGRDFTWDQSANQLELKDNALLAFGSGDDITLSWDQTQLLIDGAAADTAIHIGATNNQDIVIFGDSTNDAITIDTSAEDLELNGFDLTLLDDDVIKFGDADDITMTWDQTKFVIEGATADTIIAIGQTTNQDVIIYGDTSTDAVTFDTSAEDVQFNGFDLTMLDDDVINFGDADDITITWDQTQLTIDGAAADTAIEIGKTNNQDLVIYGDTTTDAITIDTSAEDIQLNGFDLTLLDDDVIKFGDADDITITWDQTQLTIDGAAADTVIEIGKTNNQDIVIYGDTTTDSVTFDTSAELVTFAGFATTFTGTTGVITASSTATNFGGLLIPFHASSSPTGAGGVGAIFFEVDASKLWINESGTNWVGVVLS